MHVWQLQEAKAKLTQLIKDTQREPQIISRHGVNETIVMSIKQYEALLGKKESLASFLKNSPLYGIHWEADRNQSGMRDVDLFDDKEE